MLLRIIEKIFTDLWEKAKANGFSVMLLCGFIIFSQVQRYFDNAASLKAQAEMKIDFKAQIAEVKKEKSDCDEYTRNVLYKAIQANTIALEEFNAYNERMIMLSEQKTIRRYETEREN